MTESPTQPAGTANEEPALSIVVVVLGGGGYLGRCLRAIDRQIGVPKLEIIVPCDEALDNAAALKEEFPRVQFVGFPGRRSYAELRAAGFHRARSPIVALTEDHCSPVPEWCRNILKAHAGAAAAVGGPVDKIGSDSALNWAVYLNDFSRYMSPVKLGHSQYLTDCNVSYKRAALADVADLWRYTFHETTVNWALAKRGHLLLLAPDVIVEQQRALRLGPALRERFAFGRLFASTRVAATTPLRRIAYASLSLALFVLLPGRVAANVLRKRRHFVQFARALPALVLLTAVWTIGELVGYLTGNAGDVVRQEQMSRVS